MDISTGTGIVLGSVWLLPVAAVLSKYVPSIGVYFCLFTAIGMTIYLT